MVRRRWSFRCGSRWSGSAAAPRIVYDLAMNRLSLGVLVLAWAACSGEQRAADAPPASVDAAADTIVFVVRHAETTSAAVDPPLSAAGQARAQTLATRLAPFGIAAVYSSQYLRTRDTAMAVAAAAGLTVQVRPVDSTNAATYGAELAGLVHDHDAGHAVLIVGHTNTVPDTVRALSGLTVPPISESEYDRLYTITIATDGAHVDATTY